jgi:hypothetical protein
MRDTIDMAREVYGAHSQWAGAPLERLKQLVALVRADEREACLSVIKPNATPMEIAAAIRAKGETK